ncbi:hypothetical protein [Pontibacter ummariensis]|uniref:hypothetical protein n=1 Tax=Pontibacter ummariensis TaxID=1610492 RepID=UPI000D0823EA|nr:hypothetical protein [Pontibacter ummariensis]
MAAPLFPVSGQDPDVGRTAKDNLQFIKAMLWNARSCTPLLGLPDRDGSTSVSQRRTREDV